MCMGPGLAVVSGVGGTSKRVALQLQGFQLALYGRWHHLRRERASGRLLGGKLRRLERCAAAIAQLSMNGRELAASPARSLPEDG